MPLSPPSLSLRLATTLLCAGAASLLSPSFAQTIPAPTPPSSQTAALNHFANAAVWPDTEGKHINVHGGGILFHKGVYYWYGESRNPRRQGQPGTAGVGCYTSTDLYNWKNAGVVLPVVQDDPNHDITAGAVIERPKVVYNAKTGKFVMWFHLELKGRGYSAARTASAVADHPAGPFTYLRSLRPNAGRWPLDLPDAKRTPLTGAAADALIAKKGRQKALNEGAYARRDFAGGQMARDMTVFIDDDGKGYLVASAEENYTLNFHELTDDYLDFTGKWTRATPGGHNEAPAVIKHQGKYHLLASGCTGWAPNDARVLVADSIWGPWKRSHNPCEGVNERLKMGPEKTFGGQSTFLLPVQGRPGAFIAMFDIWQPKSLVDSGHIWLPVEFENGRMKIRWREKWDLCGFTR